MKQNIHISVVVPVYNEEGNVSTLHQEIVEVCRTLGCRYEIIFINDGSSDNTLEDLKKLSPIKIINFRKNFGQTSALDAGFKAAVGDYIVALDGDGQDDPSEMPKLIAKLERENLDVVSSWRKHREDSFTKKIASLLAARLRKFLINDGIHDSGTSFKVYRRECFENIDLYGEMHRFIPAILKIKGFKIGEEIVTHRHRIHGVTKYNWSRGVKGVLDMISVWFWMKFANRPLHLFGAAGVFVMAIGFLSFIFVLGQYIIWGNDLSDNALTIISMFAILGGAQLFVFGLLADILSKSYFATTKDRPYVVKEVIEK